ncbi:MAG: hypothetical protein EOP43_00195 [Sphingobacteriaceae bacterium]|nr:MAG: hypothetical protein EOP43_00195 [Sphingobacteriaceae bacterium]
MLTKSAVDILNTYFDKIILLTIERNLYRLPNIEKNFNGLNFEVFTGIDGNKLDILELKNKGVITKNIDEIYLQDSITHMNMPVKPLLNNQIAVALSHRKIYQYIKDNGYNKVLILEDDAIPVEKNLHLIEKTLKQVPEDWELLFLGHIYNNDFGFWGRLRYYHLVNFMYRMGIRTDAVLRKMKSYPRDFSSLIKKQGGHIGTHAYALHGAGAEILLNKQTPLTHGASDFLTMDAAAKRQIKAYTCKYMFFEQNQALPSSVYNN